MPNYRRALVPGATFFFTVNLLNRRSDLLVRRMDLLREAFHAELRRRPFRIDALVVLPDHLHAIWTLPPGDSAFPERWRAIKTRFTRGLPEKETRASILLRPGEKGVWQRRYWEHMIRDAQDYQQHLEICWFNPVKHGLVDQARDWPLSSFHRDVEQGLVPADWSGRADLDPPLRSGRFG